MKQYLNFLQHILDHGSEKSDRTNTGTISTFGTQMRFDLQKGFPLLTTKKVHLKSIIHELLWFIKGDTNIQYLVQNNVRIWNEWPYAAYKKHQNYQDETMKEFVEKIKVDDDFAQKHGNLGPVYGHQWRHFDGGGESFIDQLKEVIEQIKTNPSSRRLIVSAWNPLMIEKMALPPCHMMFHFYVNDGILSMLMYQRSGDAFLGIPFNIASYSLLLMMVAQVTNLYVGEFIHMVGDAHIYKNHLSQVEEQLSRTPRDLPKMRINKERTSIEDFVYTDFTLEDYHPHPAIKGKVSV